MSGKAVNDPALHRRLSEPLDSVELATKKGQEFYEEVCKLREKYHVPELVLSFGINAKDKDGQETMVTQVGYRGGQRTDRLILELVKTTRFGEAILTMIDELTLAAFK